MTIDTLGGDISYKKKPSWKNLVIPGIFLFGIATLGYVIHYNNLENHQNGVLYNAKQKFADSVEAKASGDDNFFSQDEQLKLARFLGYEGLFREGEVVKLEASYYDDNHGIFLYVGENKMRVDDATLERFLNDF